MRLDMKHLSVAMIIALSSTAALAGNPTLEADREAINSACAQEAATANCGNEKVGTGLLKCLHAYKKAHRKDFKFSDGCKQAMEKRREDKKEIKAEKAK